VPLLTPEQCREQCRVTGDYDDALLGQLLASAEDVVSAHMNRAVFESEDALAAALDEVPDQAAAAQEAYDTAVANAMQLSSAAAKDAALRVAKARLAASDQAARRTLSGIVANPSILAAVRLTLGHLYANRESVVTGVSVAELPLGVTDLLRPYRLVMMP